MQKPKSTSWKSNVRSLAASFLVAGFLSVSGAVGAKDESRLFEKAAQQSEAQKTSQLELADALNALAEHYALYARYREAESMFRRALVLRETHLGLNHPDVARTLNGMADLFSDIDRYSEAEEHVQRALKILQDTVGLEDPEMARSYDVISEIRGDLGNKAEAESYCRRSLAVREQSLGLDHPAIAKSLNCLGASLGGQNTQEIGERALSIFEGV